MFQVGNSKAFIPFHKDPDSGLNFGRLFQLIQMALHPGNKLMLQKPRNAKKEFKIHHFSQKIFYKDKPLHYQMDKLMVFLCMLVDEDKLKNDSISLSNIRILMRLNYTEDQIIQLTGTCS